MLQTKCSAVPRKCLDGDTLGASKNGKNLKSSIEPRIGVPLFSMSMFFSIHAIHKVTCGNCTTVMVIPSPQFSSAKAVRSLALAAVKEASHRRGGDSSILPDPSTTGRRYFTPKKREATTGSIGIR